MLSALWSRFTQSGLALPGPRPWYYHNWFLVPTFIFGWPILWVSLWPAWAVLIIRSPWHTGFITGTLSWAMLLAGGVMIVFRFNEPDANTLRLAALVAPGLVVTGITQAHWTRHKQEFLVANAKQLSETVIEHTATPQPASPSPRRRKRRSGRRRR